MLRNHIHILYLLKKDLNELYVANAVRTFALSIISIFIPIFLLNEGFSFFQVGYYILLNALTMAIIGFFAMKLAAKFGIKKNMFVSGPLIILFFLMLHNISFLQGIMSDGLLIFFLGFVMGVGDSIYWTGFHVEFAKFSKKEKTAKQFGLVDISATLSSSIAPLTGGLLILVFGFQTVFIIVMILLILSITPLFLSKEHHVPFNFKFKDAASHKNSKLIFPLFGEGMHYTALAVMWPIMLYLLFASYSNVGGIYTLANAMSVVTTIFVSTRIKEINRIFFLKIGTAMHSLSIIIRMFVSSLTGMYAAMAYAGLSNAAMKNPYYSIFYNIAKKRGITSIIYLRELYLNLGRAASALMFLILLYFFSPESSIAIIMFSAAIIVLLRGNLSSAINKVKK